MKKTWENGLQTSVEFDWNDSHVKLKKQGLSQELLWQLQMLRQISNTSFPFINIHNKVLFFTKTLKKVEVCSYYHNKMSMRTIILLEILLPLQH